MKDSPSHITNTTYQHRMMPILTADFGRHLQVGREITARFTISELNGSVRTVYCAVPESDCITKDQWREFPSDLHFRQRFTVTGQTRCFFDFFLLAETPNGLECWKSEIDIDTPEKQASRSINVHQHNNASDNALIYQPVHLNITGNTAAENNGTISAEMTLLPHVTKHLPICFGRQADMPTKWQMTIHNEGSKKNTVFILGSCLTFGRSSKQDIVLRCNYNEEYPDWMAVCDLISGKHLSLEVKDNGIVLMDHSRNGTLINSAETLEGETNNKTMHFSELRTLRFGMWLPVAIEQIQPFVNTFNLWQERTTLPSVLLQKLCNAENSGKVHQLISALRLLQRPKLIPDMKFLREKLCGNVTAKPLLDEWDELAKKETPEEQLPDNPLAGTEYYLVLSSAEFTEWGCRFYVVRVGNQLFLLQTEGNPVNYSIPNREPQVLNSWQLLQLIDGLTIFNEGNKEQFFTFNRCSTDSR